SRRSHFSAKFNVKLRADLGTRCSVFIGRPASDFMLALTAQEESNTKRVAANTKKFRLLFSKICGVALLINLQKYHYLRKRKNETHVLRFFYPASTKDRKSTRLNSSHVKISYAVFCLK